MHQARQLLRKEALSELVEAIRFTLVAIASQSARDDLPSCTWSTGMSARSGGSAVVELARSAILPGRRGSGDAEGNVEQRALARTAAVDGK